jgi:hypothetical protein
LAGALRAALGDPSVELLFHVPGEHGWVTADGIGHATPLASDDRGVTEVERGGVVIGAITYDATLLTPDDVRQVARVVVLALERERLTVALRASRVRLVEAGDMERRRIAADLHDGLQSRLVLLAVQAGVNGDAELRDGLQVAIDELRALVHGVMPAELTERGLPAAVEGLTDRLPLAVALDVRISIAGCPRPSRARRTWSSPRHSSTRSSTPRPASSASRCRATASTACASRWATTESAAPGPETGRARCAIAWRHWVVAAHRQRRGPRDAGARGAAVRLVIAEDQALMREGLSLVLERAGFETVAVAASADDVVRKTLAHRRTCS